MDTDQVLGIIKQVSADIVEPRFRALHEDEIDSKAPGDYVTVADREAERALSQQLRAGARDAVVVGEE
ncbi:inositol monophosphatase, partial [Propionibacterium freudenreichii]|nr:inositol monophosphatase [Propionibacterium freudenreichii]